MKTLFLLLLFCHLSSPVMHSMKYFITTSTGLPDFPKVVMVTEVNDVPVIYCDTNRGILEPKQDWMKKCFEEKPERLEIYSQICFKILPNVMIFLMNLFDQSEERKISNTPEPVDTSVSVGKSRSPFTSSIITKPVPPELGVHVLQSEHGCEWDDETGEVTVFYQYGYDGEDFMSLDPKTFKWIPLIPKAVNATQACSSYKKIQAELKLRLTQRCPDWLKIYVDYGRSFLLKTVLPSVSLLQKTPSSPVCCHATGFYPDRAAFFWRKDGEEIDKEVDRGDILPNQDGTFQMSVDLNLSSVRPEDWRRYDCVFQFSGVKDGIVTKLDKDKIRTNWVDPPETNNMTVLIIAAVVVLALTLIAATGFIIYKRRKANSTPSSPDTIAEQSKQLNDLDTQETDKAEDREGYHLANTCT